MLKFDQGEMLTNARESRKNIDVSDMDVKMKVDRDETEDSHIFNYSRL